MRQLEYKTPLKGFRGSHPNLQQSRVPAGKNKDLFPRPADIFNSGTPFTNFYVDLDSLIAFYTKQMPENLHVAWLMQTKYQNRSASYPIKPTFDHTCYDRVDEASCERSKSRIMLSEQFDFDSRWQSYLGGLLVLCS